jgi:hypothetical protein
LRAKEEYSSGLASPDDKKRLATTVAGVGENYVQRAADDMNKEPGFDVPGGTRFRILLESDALLYSKVEFESGPLQGRVGWLSRGSFDDPRTHMP